MASHAPRQSSKTTRSNARPSVLPPFFAPVALAWAVGVLPLSGAFAAYSNAVAAERATAAREMSTVETKALSAVPQSQEVSFKRLAFDVEVDGSPLTGKKLRRRLRPFRRTVQAFEGSGQRIGVVIVNLGTGASLCYGADEGFYPASSIKGPHLIAVYDQLVETGEVPADEVHALAQPIVLYSDNEAYSTLCHRYGNETFAQWAVACGAIEPQSDDYERLMTANYPWITTRQLARMWERGFAYLDEGSPAALELESYFEQREESPIRAGLADADLTLTKAGWYPAYDGGGSAPSTCDAGIVLDGDQLYLIAIMTDAPADLAKLAELVPGVCSARTALS